jgi:fatty acid desaturase
MGKKVKGLLNFVAMLTGALVSLAVGFAMTGGTLTVPWLPSIITVVAGWIVVLTTLLSIVLAILKQ